LPSSSRKISILPWPSRRVMGSMVIRCMAFLRRQKVNKETGRQGNK
jgi:hypothetical protein